MKAFKVEMSITPKDGFNSHELKSTLQRAFTEIDLQLLDYQFEKNAITLKCEPIGVERVLDSCKCIIEYKNIPYYRQATLGTFSDAEYNLYPYFSCFNCNVSFVDFLP